MGRHAKTTQEVDEENANELVGYDRKIHRAATMMTKDMTRQLITLGIPFFGTSKDVIADGSPKELGNNQARPTMDAAGPKDTSPGGGVKVSRVELLGLQKRMLRHLEDLYGDEAD